MTHLVSFGFGVLLTAALVGGGIMGDRDDCRAAHMGRDCVVGWVVGGSFK